MFVCIESKVPHCVLLDERLSEGKGRDGQGGMRPAEAVLWFLYFAFFSGQTAFSFLHSPVAACDVKQSVFCSTKDICL